VRRVRRCKEVPKQKEEKLGYLLVKTSRNARKSYNYVVYLAGDSVVIRDGGTETCILSLTLPIARVNELLISKKEWISVPSCSASYWFLQRNSLANIAKEISDRARALQAA
jgi:hypothetical protein